MVIVLFFSCNHNGSYCTGEQQDAHCLERQDVIELLCSHEGKAQLLHLHAVGGELVTLEVGVHNQVYGKCHAGEGCCHSGNVTAYRGLCDIDTSFSNEQDGKDEEYSDASGLYGNLYSSKKVVV